MANLYRVRTDEPMGARLVENQLVMATFDGAQQEANCETIMEVMDFESGHIWHVRREQLMRVRGAATITVTTERGDKHWGVDNGHVF